jgi:four helix bundle protein
LSGLRILTGGKNGRELTGVVYGYTRRTDFLKDYGLKDQITRAAVSIMNNVAEGFDGVMMLNSFVFWAMRNVQKPKL